MCPFRYSSTRYGSLCHEEEALRAQAIRLCPLSRSQLQSIVKYNSPLCYRSRVHDLAVCGIWSDVLCRCCRFAATSWNRFEGMLGRGFARLSLKGLLTHTFMVTETQGNGVAEEFIVCGWNSRTHKRYIESASVYLGMESSHVSRTILFALTHRPKLPSPFAIYLDTTSILHRVPTSFFARFLPAESSCIEYLFVPTSRPPRGKFGGTLI